MAYWPATVFKADSGNTLSLQLTDNPNILQVKKALETQHGIPQDKAVIFLNGTFRDDKEHLLDPGQSQDGSRDRIVVFYVRDDKDRPLVAQPVTFAKDASVEGLAISLLNRSGPIDDQSLMQRIDDAVTLGKSVQRLCQFNKDACTTQIQQERAADDWTSYFVSISTELSSAFPRFEERYKQALEEYKNIEAGYSAFIELINAIRTHPSIGNNSLAKLTDPQKTMDQLRDKLSAEPDSSGQKARGRYQRNVPKLQQFAMSKYVQDRDRASAWRKETTSDKLATIHQQVDAYDNQVRNLVANLINERRRYPSVLSIPASHQAAVQIILQQSAQVAEIFRSLEALANDLAENKVKVCKRVVMLLRELASPPKVLELKSRLSQYNASLDDMFNEPRHLFNLPSEYARVLCELVHQGRFEQLVKEELGASTATLAKVTEEEVARRKNNARLFDALFRPFVPNTPSQFNVTWTEPTPTTIYPTLQDLTDFISLLESIGTAPAKNTILIVRNEIASRRLGDAHPFKLNYTNLSASSAIRTPSTAMNKEDEESYVRIINEKEQILRENYSQLRQLEAKVTTMQKEVADVNKLRSEADELRTQNQQLQGQLLMMRSTSNAGYDVVPIELPRLTTPQQPSVADHADLELARMRTQLDEALKERESLAKQIRSLENDLRVLQSEQQKKRDRAEDVARQLVETQERFEKLQDELAAAQKEAEALRAEKERAAEEFEVVDHEDQLRRDLEQAQSRIAEKEKELVEKEMDKDAALAAKVKELAEWQSKAADWQRQYEQVAQNASMKDVELIDLREQGQQSADEINQLKKKVTQLEEALTDSIGQLSVKLAETAQWQERCQRNADDATNWKLQYQQLVQKQTAMEESTRDLLQQSQNSAGEVATWKVQYQRTVELWNAAEKSAEAKSIELATRTNELAAKQNELTTRTNELAAKSNELAIKTNEVASLSSKVTALSAQLQEASQKNQELTTKTNKLNGEINDLDAQINELTAELLRQRELAAKAQEEAKQNGQNYVMTMQKVSVLEQTIAAKTSEVAALMKELGVKSSEQAEWQERCQRNAEDAADWYRQYQQTVDMAKAFQVRADTTEQVVHELQQQLAAYQNAPVKNDDFTISALQQALQQLGSIFSGLVHVAEVCSHMPHLSSVQVPGIVYNAPDPSQLSTQDLISLSLNHSEQLLRYVFTALNRSGQAEANPDKVNLVVKGININDHVLFLPTPTRQFAAFQVQPSSEFFLDEDSMNSALETAGGNDIHWIIGQVISLEDMPGNNSAVRRYMVTAAIFATK